MTDSEKNLYDFYSIIGEFNNVTKLSEDRFSIIVEDNSGWPRIIYNLNNLSDLPEAFEKAGNHIANGLPFAVISRDAIDDEAKECMRKFSVYPVELWDLMEISQSVSTGIKLPSDSEIHRIGSSEGFNEFAELVNLYLLRSEKINKSICYEMSEIDGFAFFCLRHKGEMVSTLLSYSNSGIAGLYFIVTKPEHRGKGFAGNLINYVINFLFNEGKEKVVLQSDSKAVPLYLRNGFIPVGQMVVLRKV